MNMNEEITSPNPKIVYKDRLNQFKNILNKEQKLIYEKIISTINIDQINRVRFKWKSEIDQSDPNDKSEIKYLDIPYFLTSQIKRFFLFELEKNVSGKLLDIGSGGGFFCAIANAVGYKAKGIDVPNELYEDLCRVFGVNRVINRVHAMAPLEIKINKYSIVNVAAQTFDISKDTITGFIKPWGKIEWSYFFQDIINRLDTDGRLVLDLNFRESSERGISVSDIFSCLPHGKITRFPSRPKTLVYKPSK
jgi:hypothetical protein